MVMRLSFPVNISSKPSSGRYVAAANVDGRLAIPIQPKEPSCHAISVQVSIISRNDGSTPPAAFGLNAAISPEAHISSTIAGESVRKRSDSAASADTRSRIPRARSTTDTSATSAAPLGQLPYIIGDEDRFASLIGFRPSIARWEQSLLTPCPFLYSCLFRCLRLSRCFFPCLEGVVVVIVFVFIRVVVDLEDDLVPPFVGLYPGLDVARRSRSPDQYIFQAWIAPADEGLQRLRQLGSSETDVCECPALVHSHAGHSCTGIWRHAFFPAAQRHLGAVSVEPTKDD